VWHEFEAVLGYHSPDGICTFFVLDSYGLLLSSAVVKSWSLAAEVLFNFGIFVGPAIKALLMPLNIVLVAINS